MICLAPTEMTARGERRHYLSKMCATSDGCQNSKIFSSCLISKKTSVSIKKAYLM